MNPNSYGTRSQDIAGIIGKMSNAEQNGFAIYHDFNRPKKINMRIKGAAGMHEYLSTNSEGLTQWEHWVVTYKGNTVTWYRNGTQDIVYTDKAMSVIWIMPLNSISAMPNHGIHMGLKLISMANWMTSEFTTGT